MGKFGKYPLPKFILKKFGSGILTEEDHSSDENNPIKTYDTTRTMRDLGMFPRTAKLTKARILKVYDNTPESIKIIQDAGYKVRAINLNIEVWADVLTVYGKEKVLHFEFEEDTFQAEDVDKSYGSAEFIAYDNDWEYSIPVMIYNPKNGDKELEDVDLEGIEAKPLKETDYMHSSNKKAHMRPTQYQRDVEYADPDNYYKKTFNKIIEFWENGPKKMIEFNAYREHHTVSDPRSQFDATTGNITTDRGEVIPFDDIYYIQIDQYTADVRDPKDKGKLIKNSMKMTYPNGKELAHHAYYDDTPFTPKKRTDEHKVFENFQEYEKNEKEVNEEDLLIEPEEMAQPCEGCSEHPDTLSEAAKAAIKNMCDTVLIKEAHLYEASDDPNMTYESFLKECSHYLAECLIRAAQNLKV